MTTVVEPVGGDLRGALWDAFPLLLSVGLLMAGNGLTSTLLGVRGGLEGMAPSVVGIVLAGYYAGFVVGSLAAPSTIVRVGHVRVFSGLASLASGAVLIHVVQPNPVSWFVLRVISGVCISALYVVCETWLNGTATNRSRGGLLAAYSVMVSGSLLGGQVIFSVSDAAGFTPFVVASVLVSLAVVPVSLASYPAPPAPDASPISLRRLVAVAPLGAAGAMLSGFIGAAMLGAGAVYASEAGFGQAATGAFIGAALLGGAVLQVPLGAWSDRVDRRLVIAVAAFAAAVMAVAASTVPTDRRLVLIALVAVAGGATFPLYSLSLAHMNDYLDPSLVVAGGARMVLVNGAGSVAGPIVGGVAVGTLGPPSLFLVMAAGYLVIGLFALYRMTRRPAVPEEQRTSFVPVVVGVGPLGAAGLEAEAAELYPPEYGEIEAAGSAMTYREQGVGPPVVLVDDSLIGDRWAEVEPALALDGVRVLTVRIGPRFEDTPEDYSTEALLALLRHLELPWATVVASDTDNDAVVDFVAEHPDRIEAAVLFGPPRPTQPVEVGGPGEPGEPAAPSRPVLVLDPDQIAEDPEGLADDIADFVRRLPTVASTDAG